MFDQFRYRQLLWQAHGRGRVRILRSRPYHKNRSWSLCRVVEHPRRMRQMQALEFRLKGMGSHYQYPMWMSEIAQQLCCRWSPECCFACSFQTQPSTSLCYQQRLALWNSLPRWCRGHCVLRKHRASCEDLHFGASYLCHWFPIRQRDQRRWMYRLTSLLRRR